MLLAIPQGTHQYNFLNKSMHVKCAYTQVSERINMSVYVMFMLDACFLMLPILHISPLQTLVTAKDCKKRQREYKGQLVGVGKALEARQTEKYVFILSLTQVQELR